MTPRRLSANACSSFSIRQPWRALSSYRRVFHNSTAVTENVYDSWFTSRYVAHGGN
ncbi:MAG: hypothetical protein V9E82_10210 [Candidatus Nanopelagicales bacterium]